jgi:ABC-type oligopeptide transport system ATPase subunit
MTEKTAGSTIPGAEVTSPILRIDNVYKTFHRGKHTAVKAVSGVSLDVGVGKTVALIGESGSGKSTLARLGLGLYLPDSGTVSFEGTDLTTLSAKALRELRSRMTMVFQEPFESLDPRHTVGSIIAEPLVIHEKLSRQERKERVIETMRAVTLPESFYDRRPGELSGGQQQRVGVARAIITNPPLVILDEPTASLDLSVRAQILRLLAKLRAERNLSYLFVSHDLPTVNYIADDVAVMFRGKIVEYGPVEQVLQNPQHVYTQMLLSSTLSPNPEDKTEAITMTYKELEELEASLFKETTTG